MVDNEKLERHQRINVLKLSIADAEERIASNPTDDNYVAQQQAKIMEWSKELGHLQTAHFEPSNKC